MRPRYTKVVAPKPPIAADIAPNAPSGARRMIKPRILKSTVWNSAMPRRITESGLLVRVNAMPTRSEMNKTCRISPLAKASTSVVGMMLSRKFTTVSLLAAADAPAIIALGASSLAWSPNPGRNTFTAIAPTTMPSVLMVSKYSRDFAPRRPSFRMSFTPAKPWTTVTKMMGPRSILSSAMKPSPKGFIFVLRKHSCWQPTFLNDALA